MLDTALSVLYNNAGGFIPAIIQIEHDGGKNMKKIIALLLAAIMVLGLAACASKTETKEASDVKNVVYIVNGNLGDKSFFDSAQAGIDELVKAGRITCKTIELGGTDEDQPKWLSTLYDVSESGEYDLVICGTYQMPDYLK